MQLKSVVQININLTDFWQYFSTFSSLQELDRNLSLFWWYYLIEYRCVRRFSSHLKILYFRKFSSRIWPLPGASFTNENIVKEKDSRQATCTFVNSSNSSTYGRKISKICDLPRKSLVGSYVHSLLIYYILKTK